MVTQSKNLNGSAIPVQGPTPNAKLAVRGYQINLHRRFIRALLRNEARMKRRCKSIEASPTVEKAVSCYKPDRLWFSYPRARAHPKCEVITIAVRGYQINLHRRFIRALLRNEARMKRRCKSIEASPTVEKAVSCYKPDRLSKHPRSQRVEIP